MVDSIQDWLDSINSLDRVLYAKRLSANDAGATESHQAGIYIPKHVLWNFFPKTKSGTNPDAWFTADILPYSQTRNLRAIWYNEKTRNESRITQWNRPSRILEPEMTGGLVVFAFQIKANADIEFCSIWFCQNEEEEDAVEDIIGIVDPGEGIYFNPDGLLSRPTANKSISDFTEADIPEDWLINFPTPQQIVEFSFTVRPSRDRPPDARLLARRECETALFYSVERASVFPLIQNGFSTVDEFVDLANSVTNRRKSRAGRSLELQLKMVFIEEGLEFSHGEISEGKKKPDFIFPSISAYKNPVWPDANIRMLAAKTTCKDRWRQILTEADRIPCKHLVTLQQGVSLNQYSEMKQAGVILVVPEALHKSYPASVQPELVTLKSFIEETKGICGEVYLASIE